MSSVKQIQHGQKNIPKGLTNQLQMIRRDQEIENKQKKQQRIVTTTQVDEDDKLESDKLVSSVVSAPKITAGLKDWETDSSDRWQKVGSEKVRKTIRKEESSGKGNASGNRWVKNGVAAQSSVVQSSERRKICIVKDQNGKRIFKDVNNAGESSADLINSQPQSNKAAHLKIHTKQENQSQNEKYDQQYKEYGNADDKRRNRDFDEENEEEQYQEQEEDSLEQEMNQQREQKQCGFIEVTNLPRQIDSAYLKDLLKKEKSNILDSLKRDYQTGYVKFSSMEAAQRAILILNKRKLFNHEIAAHLIEEDEFQSASGVGQEIKPSQKSGGVHQRIQLKPIRK